MAVLYRLPSAGKTAVGQNHVRVPVLLSIYLNDHLAAATGGRELARRVAASNRSSDYGPFLERLAEEIEEDRESLLLIMRTLDVKVDPLKLIVGWGAEKVARLKLNGRLFGYSPLSRLIELETLGAGLYAKLALWRSLEQLESDRIAGAGITLSDLVARVERQLDELELHRARAVIEAISGEV
jgi:hypothetical protein